MENPLYVLVKWPDSQEFMDKEGVHLSDESAYFVPVEVYKETLEANNK